MTIKRPESPQPLPPNAKKVFDGIIFDVYQWEQTLFDGTVQTYEKLKRPDTVLVIPITEDGKIMILDEEQPGKKPFTSVPGGKVDPGENPLNAVKRELLEETGYEATEYALFDAFQPTSKIDWAIYTFVATGCKKTTDTKLEAGEKINMRFVSFDQFIDAAMQDQFQDDRIKFKVMEAIIYPQKMQMLKKTLQQVTD